MFTTPPSKNSAESNAPLFCWDIAHPSLQKRIQTTEDIKCVQQLATQFQWDWTLDTKSLLVRNYTLVITNLSKEIVWASQHFEKLTGYACAEVIGRKPTFLQGEETSQKSLQTVREKLSTNAQVETKLLNYRKNGETYWCEIRILPIHNADGFLTHFIAIEKEVDY